MFRKRKTPGGGNHTGALVSLYTDYATKIANGQIKNNYWLEVSFFNYEENEPVLYTIGASDDARSLLIICLNKKGLTRAEALSRYHILSLTQHVHNIREQCKFYDLIETERIGPKRYARYHLSSNVQIKLFKEEMVL